MAEPHGPVRIVASIAVLVVLVLATYVVLLAIERPRSGPTVAKVVSVSTQPGLAPSQMVCASGSGTMHCTAVAPGEPGAPFEVGDCVEIPSEGIARTGLKPRSCD